MYTEEELQILAEKFSQRFSNVNTEALEYIGEKLKEIGELTPAQAKEIQQMYSYGEDLEDITNRLSRASGMSRNEVEKLYSNVAKENYKWSEPFYEAIGKTQKPFKENEALQKMISATAKFTADTMKNISRTTALGVVDKNGFMSLTDFYKNTVDNAITAVATGVTDYNKAIRQSIKVLGGSGLRVKYQSGYTKRLDSAVRQNIIDGVRYINQETQRIAGEEFGADGVEISAHSPCAPDHVDCQGQQYSNKEYDELNRSLNRPIGQWNCGHFAFSILLGVSTPAYSKEQLRQMREYSEEPVEIDGKEYSCYECTQLQRKLETGMRYARDEKALAKTVGDKELQMSADYKITLLKNKYVELCDKAGLKTRLERAQTVAENIWRRNAESGISNKRQSITASAKVDLNFINSASYKNKFKKITDNRAVNAQIYKQAKAMLTHRNGTFCEDMCLINGKTGSIEGKQSSSTVTNNVIYNDSLKNAIKRNPPYTLISIHNHGTNIPPTGKDFTSNGSHRYKLGVVVCHDGTVYTYKVGNKAFTSGELDKRVEKYKKIYYNILNDKEVHEKVLDEFIKEYGIEWRKM